MPCPALVGVVIFAPPFEIGRSGRCETDEVFMGEGALAVSYKCDGI